MLLFQQNTGICTMLGQKGGLYAPLIARFGRAVVRGLGILFIFQHQRERTCAMMFLGQASEQTSAFSSTTVAVHDFAICLFLLVAGCGSTSS
jgi:hypothetical protein